MRNWKVNLKQHLMSHAPTLVCERGRLYDQDERERRGDKPTLPTLLFLHLSSFIIPFFEPFMDVFRPDDYDLNRFRWARFTNALDGTSIPVVGHVRHVLFYGEEVACRIEYGVAPGLSRKCSVYGDRRILALEALSRKYRKLVHIAEKTIAEKNVPSPAYVLRITPQEWAMLRTRREYQDLVTWIREAGYELRLTSIDAKSMNVTVRPVSSQRGAVQCTTRIPIGDATELEVITLHAIEHTAR